MVKKLRNTNFDEFYKVNEYVANNSPMMTHYHSSNPAERWLWSQKKKQIKKIIKELSIKNILDFGCGDAGMLEVIPKEIEYLGVDISPTQIAYAKETIKKSKHKKASVKVSDILDLKIKDNTFDAALLCDVVEHVLNPHKLFSEIKRVTKKDGYIIMSIPNEQMWLMMRAALLRFPLHSPDHLHSFEPKDIKKNFKKIDKEIYIPVQFSSQLSLIHIFSARNVK